MIRVLVADDHEQTRRQIVDALATGGVIKVIAQAETSNETLKTAEKLLPDVILLDVYMPGLLTIYELLKRLNALRNVKVIMFAPEGKAAEVQDLLEGGASGYVLKTDAPALIRMAILMVSRGSRNVISPSLPRHVTHFTPQERSVLRHLTRRGRLPQIAQRMGLTEAELNDVLAHLCNKLELPNADKLIKWAKKHGF